MQIKLPLSSVSLLRTNLLQARTNLCNLIDPRNDHFFDDKLKLESYQKLAFVLKVIFTLSHGNAAL